MEDLPIRTNVVIPGHELREAFVRSAGPGGQNVNKVATKVELRWTPGTTTAVGPTLKRYLLARLASRLTNAGELVVTADEGRTQGRNRQVARDKLGEIVRRSLERPKTRRPTKPTRGSVQRRVTAKKRRGQLKASRRTPDDS